MTSIGPLRLGRSVVVRASQKAPEPWHDADRLTIDSAVLTDPTRLAETVHDLTRRYVNRIPTVFVLDVDPEDLNAPETTDAPPYELGG